LPDPPPPRALTVPSQDHTPPVVGVSGAEGDPLVAEVVHPGLCVVGHHVHLTRRGHGAAGGPRAGGPVAGRTAPLGPGRGWRPTRVRARWLLPDPGAPHRKATHGPGVERRRAAGSGGEAAGAGAYKIHTKKEVRNHKMKIHQ